MPFLFTVLIAATIKSFYAISYDNLCTFRTGGKLFSLTYLQKSIPYKISNQNDTVYFNFCSSFLPEECVGQQPAFSFIINKSLVNGLLTTNCTRYSSNETTSLFTPLFEDEGNGAGTLTLSLYNQDPSKVSLTNPEILRTTIFTLTCEQERELYVSEFDFDEETIEIEGWTKSACPILEISTFWTVLTNNEFLFGIVLIILGFYLLFYGHATLEITVFIATFFVTLIILASFLTLFISPNSSTITIYVSMLVLLFICCFLAYLATRLLNVTVALVGALFGLVLGMFASSIFTEIFEVYSSWTMPLFAILFSVPLGLLTFKYRDDVIIASTSFTGAYLIVRPLSWMIGGFPNEFTLYDTFQTGKIVSLPWTFFVYLILIICISIVGGMYQTLKLQREDISQQVEVNFIQESIEGPIDAVKIQVDKLIERFRSEKQLEKNDEYYSMEEMGDKRKGNPQIKF